MGHEKSLKDEMLLVRRTRALQLCLEGKMTRDQIAATLGISKNTFYRDISWMIAHETMDNSENARTMRVIEDERLDRCLNRAMAALDSAHELEDVKKMIDTIIKIQERRAKLLGLDAPIKQEIETTSIQEVTPAMARAAMLKNFPNAVGPGGKSGDEPPPDEPN